MRWKFRGTLKITLALACLLATPAGLSEAEAAPKRRGLHRRGRPVTVLRSRRVRRVRSQSRIRSLRPARRLEHRRRLREVSRIKRKTKVHGLRLPAMPLYHVHNREAMRIRLYDAQGKLRAAAFRRFTRFMRCTHTARARKIHWRLLVVLYDLWLHFGQPQVSVFSGHRPQVVARLKTSRHVTGHAIDFNFDAISNVRVRKYLLKHYPQVGVGFYPNSFHVHLDVRPKKTFWIDYGSPGEAAMYSRTPGRDLRQGVAKRGFRPRVRKIQRALRRRPR